MEDSPFEVDRAEIERFRKEAGQGVQDALRASGGAVAEGAAVAAEVALGLLLGLIVTFFVLKDGDHFLAWARRHLPEEQHELAGAGRRPGPGGRWAATCGARPSSASSKGSPSPWPSPWSARSSPSPWRWSRSWPPSSRWWAPSWRASWPSSWLWPPPAGRRPGSWPLVALVVQQLDNDVLAPVVYGKALELHPVVVLLAILAGGSAFGLIGSFLAVPVVAVAVNAAAEARVVPREGHAVG